MEHRKIMQFKKLFEDQKKSILYAKDWLNDSFFLRPEDRPDELDLTATETETAMRLRLRSREVLFIKKVDEALARIASGTFGCCESCDGEIELKRLEARPTTTLCLECKEEQERVESLHWDGLQSKSLGVKIRFA